MVSNMCILFACENLDNVEVESSLLSLVICITAMVGCRVIKAVAINICQQQLGDRTSSNIISNIYK